MQALVVSTLMGPSAMAVEDVPRPVRQSDHVLINVVAAGMAFPDLLLSQGLYQYKPDLPFIPGSEVSGFIAAAPEGSGYEVGQRVAAYPFLGGFSEQVCTPAERVFPVDDSFDLFAAAAMPINYLTMHFGLIARGRLMPGEWVVVHGAGGGLGLAAIQLAKAWGARTIAVASSPEKRQAGVDAGADHAIEVECFLERVRALTGGEGANMVVDPVGGERVTDSLRCLAPFGRLLVLGFTSGEIAAVKTNRLLLNNLDVIGVGWGAYAIPRVGYMRSQWDDLIARMQLAGVSPVQPEVVSLADIPDRLAAMADRSLAGKVVARLS